jgi:predicted transcriptional regulator
MNELSFLDLAILKKTDAESSVEKFGSMINTSFFETANLLGTIKIKGYINIESSIGGISKVTITDAGTSILAVAGQKAKGQIEPLDNAILHALAAGTKDLDSLQNALNIRSGDLAYHLNKLVAQGFADYEIRSAKVSFMLTEQGFNATGGVRVQQNLVSPAEFAGEEDESGSPAPASAKHAPSSDAAPPWVNPSDVKKEEHKDDVAHLLKDEHEHHKHEGTSESKHKPLSPEEQKRQEKHRRMASKMHYYFHEYLPYLVLLIIVGAIFIGAIFLGLSKFV